MLQWAGQQQTVLAQKCCALEESEWNPNGKSAVSRSLIVFRQEMANNRCQNLPVSSASIFTKVTKKRNQGKWMCNWYYLFHHNPPMSFEIHRQLCWNSCILHASLSTVSSVQRVCLWLLRLACEKLGLPHWV